MARGNLAAERLQPDQPTTSDLGWQADIAFSTIGCHFGSMYIKVMADYDCAPLWWDEISRVGNINPDELGLSQQLVTDLWAWAASYDASLNRDDPTQSGFETAFDQRDFDQNGRALSRRVAAELSGYHVRYWRDANVR